MRKKYRPISVHFDTEDSDDIELLNWLEDKKSKVNSYSAQIRKALKEYIDKRKQ